jgi:hypothetical protein
VSLTVEKVCMTGPGCLSRSISRSLEKVDDGVHGHEKASQRLASMHAMRPATQRGRRRVSARFDARHTARNGASLVCKRPIALLGVSETNPIGV